MGTGWPSRIGGCRRGARPPVARAVDVESRLQQTLLRMWLYWRDRGRELEGPAASLRFAIGMARNIAPSEARRTGRIMLAPPRRCWRWV